MLRFLLRKRVGCRLEFRVNRGWLPLNTGPGVYSVPLLGSIVEGELLSAVVGLAG